MFLKCGFFQCGIAGEGSLPVDTSDELVVDINLLAFASVCRHYLFMYHDFFDQLVEHMGSQLCEIGLLPNDRQELLYIFIDLLVLGDLRSQLLPFLPQQYLLPLIVRCHGLIPLLTDLLQS